MMSLSWPCRRCKDLLHQWVDRHKSACSWLEDVNPYQFTLHEPSVAGGSAHYHQYKCKIHTSTQVNALHSNYSAIMLFRHRRLDSSPCSQSTIIAAARPDTSCTAYWIIHLVWIKTDCSHCPCHTQTIEGDCIPPSMLRTFIFYGEKGPATWYLILYGMRLYVHPKIW